MSSIVRKKLETLVNLRGVFSVKVEIINHIKVFKHV